MKFCPMCGMSQFEAGATVCAFCDYEEKALEEHSEQELNELMEPYEYERIHDGLCIKAVKNGRHIGLRGTVALPQFVTEISAGAFEHCKFITRLALPKSLRTIGDYAFAQCRDLFDVFIPENVGYIGKGAFADCFDLGVICAAAPEQPSTWDTMWLADCTARVEWSSTYED